MGAECGLWPEVRWNRGQSLVRPEPFGLGRFYFALEEHTEMKSRKSPWWIWLSFGGLVLVLEIIYFRERRLVRERRAEKRKISDEELNRWLGFCGRFICLMLGLVILPMVLMGTSAEQLPEPWAAILIGFSLVYFYFACVFVTSRLYQFYFFGKHK